MTGQVTAEDAVLGGLLLDNQRLHDVAVLLGPEQFTSPQRARIYGAIRSRVLAGEAADAVTIGEAYPEDFEAVITLASTTPSAASVVSYARIVRNNWRKREAVRIGLSLASKAREGDDEAVGEATRELMQLDATVTECEFTGKQALKMAWEQVEHAYSTGGALQGITSGLSELDKILGGFHDSDLTIIGARPAMGKTALLCNLAEAAANAGRCPGIISAEQPASQLALRRLSMVSKVGASALRAGRITDDDWASLTHGISVARDRDMWIYDRSAITLDELISVARKWRHQYRIGALYVDYAQRIRVPGADRITEVSEVARGLKNLARDLQIPVIALAQVIKGVDSREDKRPNAGDLANSDELTREADQILMLYRDAAYYTDKLPSGEPVNRALAEILIEKNRHGPTGWVQVAFLEETMRFADLSGEAF